MVLYLSKCNLDNCVKKGKKVYKANDLSHIKESLIEKTIHQSTLVRAQKNAVVEHNSSRKIA